MWMAAVAQRRLVAASCRNIVGRREFSALVSPAEEFPGLPSVEPTPSKASTGSVTKLSNGVTVVTEDASTVSTVSITFPNGGSASESMTEVGAALVNRCLTFKSGSELSTVLIMRNLEDDGAIPFKGSDRQSATVGYTAAPDKALRLVPLLVVDCAFEPWDVVDARKAAASHAQDASTSAQLMLTSQLYAAAFGPQSPLGKPYFTTGTSLDGIMSFRDRTYGIKGAVVAATGIADHASFCAAVEVGFGEANPGMETPPPSTAYMGGEARLWAPSSGYAHVTVALHAPPGTSTAVCRVVEACLRLSAGESGVSAFTAAPGLVGVYANGSTAEAGTLADRIVACWKTKLTPETIARAKLVAKAEAIFGVEDAGSRGLANAMTHAVLETGSFGGSVGAAYDAVTDAQVMAAYNEIIKSNPAVAAVGDIAHVPYHATIAGNLK